MGKPLSLKCLQASWKENWRQAVSLGRGRHDGLGDEWHVAFLLLLSCRKEKSVFIFSGDCRCIPEALSETGFCSLFLFSRSGSRVRLFATPRLQHTRLPCPSPSPGIVQTHAHWANDAIQPISSSVVPFSSHLQPFSASGSFPIRRVFASGGQTIGASASASVLPMSIQGWFPLGWTGLIFLLSKGLARVFSTSKASVLWPSVFSMVQLSHSYLTTGKNTYGPL